MKPLFSQSESITSIKEILKLTYSEGPLPEELVSAYFVPEKEKIWEIRYRLNPSAKNMSIGHIPAYLILLESRVEVLEDGDRRFTYKEIGKLDIEEGTRVRRTGGDLSDFIGKKLYRTQYNLHKNKFFINFPVQEIKDLATVKGKLHIQLIAEKIYDIFDIRLEDYEELQECF